MDLSPFEERLKILSEELKTLLKTLDYDIELYNYRKTKWPFRKNRKHNLYLRWLHSVWYRIERKNKRLCQLQSVMGAIEHDFCGIYGYKIKHPFLDALLELHNLIYQAK